MSGPRFYRMRLVKAGPLCGIKIWYGPPVDPADGLPMWERPYMHRCAVNGVDTPIDDVAPWIADGTGDTTRGDEIDEAEYLYFVEQRLWAVTHAPDDPAAKPRSRVDLNKMPAIRF